jgi:hypothetical protein
LDEFIDEVVNDDDMKKDVDLFADQEEVDKL